MLIVFPLGLLATAVVFDILYLLFGNPDFPVAAFWMIIAGGLIAAIFGLIDWLAIPGGTRAKSIGLIHAIGNVIIIGLFAVSWFLRRDAVDYVPSTLALLFSFAGALLAVYTGWLGGELVYRLGMAVDRGANLNAPSSLSAQPAGEVETDSGPVLAPTGRPSQEEDEERR